jgi:hypothetical protein
MTDTARYTHGEAFCLMTYRSDDGTEEEIIWNSRDGVTPFVITLRSGKEARHIDWQRDRRVPDHTPPAGTRIFVDLTDDAARRYAAANAERFFAEDDPPGLAREQYGTVEAMAAHLAAGYLSRPGTPDLVEVQNVNDGGR